VAAYGVLLYINTVFLSVFFGYTIGASPIVGYHYGAGNHAELKGLLKKSVGIIAVASATMFLLAQLLATPLSMLFVGYDAALLDMTRHGLRIYAFSFLFVGFGYFTPGFFTALNDAATSATISMLRTLVAQIAAVLLLPLAFGLDGIWASVVAAEVMAMTMAVFCLAAKRGKYHYW
jgi:Na+-driven multidrug efflux pump